MSRSSEKPGYFPVAINLRDRDCLVVGGGKVALRKVCGLLESGGRVTVTAPQFCEELEALGREGAVELRQREYVPREAARFGLVIAASDSLAVNNRVFNECRAASVPVNVVDDPEHCDFIIPANLKRGPLTVSIGTGGTAPFFTKWIRERLEEMLPGHWDEMARLAGRFRERVLADGSLGKDEKNVLFRRFLAADWEGALAVGIERAEELMKELLKERP